MPKIIDVSSACGSYAGFLAGAGVETVIRYYSRDTGIPSKRLSRSEAEQFDATGLRICVVHEAKHGDRPESFSMDLGVKDATYALDYGSRVIRQPPETAIYFAVDFDASVTQVNSLIIPYFEGIRSVLKAPDGASTYRIGVYGSGRVCRALTGAQLVELTWLAQSTGWAEYASYKRSNQWALLQQKAIKVGEIACDPNTRNANGLDIGDFMLEAGRSSIVADGAGLGERSVIAGSGLRLRAGPSTDFDIIGLIPLGAKVVAMKVVGDWTMVDTDGDGAADGFMSSHFLT